jgi:protein phosphatase PTC1
MIVRFNKSALQTATKEPSSAIGVEGDPTCVPGKISEVDKIVGDAKRKVAEDGVHAVGVSGSNSGKGHDPKLVLAEERERVSMEKVVEEEPGLVEGEEANEVDLKGAEAASPETRMKLQLPEGPAK